MTVAEPELSLDEFEYSPTNSKPHAQIRWVPSAKCEVAKVADAATVQQVRNKRTTTAQKLR